MNRELKFRVWNGMEMVYDVTVGKFGTFYVNPSNNGLDPNDSASLTPNTTKYSDTIHVMQFTGLKDREGNEIFEGDIVNISYGIAIVKFIDACGAFMLQWIDDREAKMELVAFSNNGYKLGRSRTFEEDIPKVIGNIYSNPELLREGFKF